MTLPRTHPDVASSLRAAFSAHEFRDTIGRIEHRSEASAAERFVRLHGDDVRYDHRRGRWLLWRSHRWVPDSDAGITRLGLKFAREWQREAVEIADREDRQAALRAALRLERRDALTSMLALARDLKPIADSGDAWDVNPSLLCTPNGVIDLTTGTLVEGRRRDRITFCTAVAFNPDAEAPRWTKFVSEIFGGDPQLVAFFHRAIGYSLTGEMGEQCLFMAYGLGANGKGTATNTIAAILADYAYAMPFSTVEQNQRAAIPNDLAALVGRRFVIASETSDGARLNEPRIKALTGGDPITARYLHGEFFSFRPMCKLWLATNHRPIVRDDSRGFWRRMRLIPFEQTFAINAGLQDELMQEAEGILAWAVRGCLAWRCAGLDAPDRVLAATKQYEHDSDLLADFIAEACIVEGSVSVGASDLFGHYRRWAEKRGMTDRERLTATAFGRKIATRFQRVATRRGNTYQGVGKREF